MRCRIALGYITAPLILLAVALFIPEAVAQAGKTAYPASQTREVTTVESSTEETTESITAAAEQDFVPQQEISEDYPIALPVDI